MSKGYWREFTNLKELSLEVVQQLRGVVTEACMRLKSAGGIDLRLTIVRPMLRDRGPSVRLLCETLSSDGIDSIIVQGEPQEHNEALRWRIEILREGKGSVIISCREIRGLPG